jgi:uncharacterized protein YebE (UPF0316 family)
MEIALVFSGLLIFLARVLDMSLATFRILMLMRGRSLLASTIGFLESGIYLLALSRVGAWDSEAGLLKDQGRLLIFKSRP